MTDHLKRVFLSYSSKDVKEVDRLDLELRRRGVPLWRDRDNLGAGRETELEIERASREAAGFVFYLTRDAVDSPWVRETERSCALDNHSQRHGFGIVPIFRHAIDEVGERMRRLGENAARHPADYDLGRFAGYVIDPAAAAKGRLDTELRKAADAVLDSLMRTIGERSGRGEKLKVGLMTRGGPALAGHPLDLMLDWTEDYRQPPEPGFCRERLLPALQDFRSAAGRILPSRALRVVAQCHLTMALAFGFEYRRNVGVELEVVEPHGGDVWLGPAAPFEPAAEAWWDEKLPPARPGAGVALAVNVTRKRDEFQQEVQDYLSSGGPGVSRILYFEPAVGPSMRALKNRGAEEPHRMAVAVVEGLLADPEYQRCDAVHLFIAAPPGFAILLAQQLSNTRVVQTYEWLPERRTYVPCWQLVSS